MSRVAKPSSIRACGLRIRKLRKPVAGDGENETEFRKQPCSPMPVYGLSQYDTVFQTS